MLIRTLCDRRPRAGYSPTRAATITSWAKKGHRLKSRPLSKRVSTLYCNNLNKNAAANCLAAALVDSANRLLSARLEPYKTIAATQPNTSNGML